MLDLNQNLKFILARICYIPGNLLSCIFNVEVASILMDNEFFTEMTFSFCLMSESMFGKSSIAMKVLDLEHLSVLSETL